MVAERKKLPPNKNEEFFIALASKIRTRTITSLDEADQRPMPAHLKGTLTSLLEGIRDFGEEGFWKAYRQCEEDYPRMKEWRKAIETEAAPEGEQEPPPPKKYRPVTLLEMMGRPQASDIIEDIFYEKTVGLLFGISGTKKSFLAFDFCAHIAMNIPWQGHQIKKPGICVYTVAEGADSFIKRARSWCAYHHVALEDLSQRLVLVEREIPLGNGAEVTEYIESVREYLGDVQPIVVVFDTLMRCSGGENINAPDGMSKLFDGANLIRRELDAAHALIVHHEGKDATKGSAGSFVLRANCDIVHRLTCDADGTLTLSCNPAVGGKIKDKAEYPDIYLNTQTVYYTEEALKDDSSLVIISGEMPMQEVKLTLNRRLLLEVLPETQGFSFTEWWQAVNTSKQADGLAAMAKQTFIDNKDWLVNQNLVRKIGTDEGTETNTYQKVKGSGIYE